MATQNKITLTPRLQAVADYVPSGAKIADIGTDHAYIPLYLVLKEIINSGIAADIKAGPIRIAKQNIAKYNLSDKVIAVQSNGISALSKGDADTIIIAGMGGILICEILENGKAFLQDIDLLILQPMTAIENVREYLHKNNFYIKDEKLVREGEKIYTVIVAQHGIEVLNDEFYYTIGKRLIENKDELLLEFVSKKITKTLLILNSIAKNANDENKRLYLEFETMLKRYCEIKEMCSKW